MSGHSKWSTIKRKKGAADAKRGTLFTQLSNAITVAAKQGGGDIDMNFALRLATDRARSSNMPKDNVERAIKRGTGELAGAIIEELCYEGFGPSGTAFIIDALTDNKNRSVASIKHALVKHGGSLGATNSVQWMFDKKGIIRLDKTSIANLEEAELAAIDAGANDVLEEDDELVIYTATDSLASVKQSLEKSGMKIEYAELEWVAKENIEITDPKIKARVQKLFDDLDDNEDVHNFYTNAII